jgi:acyl carrier protein
METRVKQIMQDMLEIDAATIGESTRMETVPTWDSVVHVNLCASLEEEFALTLSASEMESMVSYPAILKVLATRE